MSNVSDYLPLDRGSSMSKPVQISLSITNIPRGM
jgi:hypothetical protein